MEILFDENGTPLSMHSTKIFAETKTKPSKTVNETPQSTFFVDGTEFVSWGSNNRMPDDGVIEIARTGVLSTAIGFKARTSFGQGIFPCLYTGRDEQGRELFTPFSHPSVDNFIDSPQFQNYATAAFRDLFKLGNAFPVFYFNAKGQIINIVCLNARHCRLSKDKKQLLVYPDFWQNTPSSKADCDIIPMLDESDPFTDFDTRLASGKINFSKPLAYPRLRNYYSNTDYYGVPDWHTVWLSGWLEVAHMVPKFLAEAYKNAMTMMWHIQIPSTWYEKRFPLANYKDRKGGIQQREQDIRNWWAEFETKMTGTESSNKTLFSEYGIDDTGRGEDKWIITRLENEIDAKERLNTSAAANSEILFSMMINPSTLGAGMPGGSYAGTAGSGSDIRESYLVSVITTYIEKQQILFPLRLMFHHNGLPDNLRFRFKETILTTLNTGQSQQDITT